MGQITSVMFLSVYFFTLVLMFSLNIQKLYSDFTDKLDGALSTA